MAELEIRVPVRGRDKSRKPPGPTPPPLAVGAAVVLIAFFAHDLLTHHNGEPSEPELQEAPRIAAFAAVPGQIPQGGTALLVWETEHAASVRIKEVGAFRPNGTHPVTPNDTTTYELTAVGESSNATGDPATATVTVLMTPPSPQPRILKFTADNTQVSAPGDSVTLRWETRDAERVVITPYPGEVRSDPVVVEPTESTTYTLWAYRGDISVSAEVNVDVTTPETAPRIIYFRPDRPTIQRGQNTLLVWKTEHAASVKIKDVGTFRPNSTHPVTPNDTTTYELTAVGESSNATVDLATAKVTVLMTPPSPQPRILKFTADETQVSARGDSVTLKWETLDAERVVITPYPGEVRSDPVVVEPTESTTYTLWAYRGDISVSAELTVHVEAPHPEPGPCSPVADDCIDEIELNDCEKLHLTLWDHHIEDRDRIDLTFDNPELKGLKNYELTFLGSRVPKQGALAAGSELRFEVCALNQGSIGANTVGLEILPSPENHKRVGCDKVPQPKPPADRGGVWRWNLVRNEARAIRISCRQK